jgi:hypothetical protein
MPRSGLRKLVDVHGTLSQAAPIHDALQAFLLHHSISWQVHSYTDKFDGHEFWRYFVNGRDLCCAQSVLPAIKDLQERGAA